MTTEQIPNLHIEREGGVVTVSQSKAGAVSSVVLHPIHLRHLAEAAGLVPASNRTAAKQIATLTRRLRLLHRRIDELDHHLANFTDKRADLSQELSLVVALSDLADEFIADLDQPDNPGQAP